MRTSRPRTRSAAREHIVTIDTDSAPRIMFSGENFVVGLPNHTGSSK